MKGVSSATDGLIWTLCLFCALSLQTQVTLFSSEDYLGLRINLTDLALPLAGIAILASLLRKKSQWPQFPVPHFYAWLSALTIALAGALLNCWYLYGEISQWALVNKFIGWFVLLATMGLGAWIAANASRRQLDAFLKTFIYVALIGVAVQVIFLVVSNIGGMPGTYIIPPVTGLMANRNAYAFLIIAVMIVATCLYFSQTPAIKPTLVYILYSFLPFFALFNTSRAACFTLGTLIILFLIMNRRETAKCVRLLLCLTLGGLLAYGFFAKYPESVPYLTPRLIEVFQGIDTVVHRGDKMRMEILRESVFMAQERPIFGSGLGSGMLDQERGPGQALNIIDNTPLWLLVETGMVGLLLFAGFYMAVVRGLFRQTKNDGGFSKPLRQSMLYLVLAFTIMCLLHELMYTRFLWFFLGLALALPARMRQDG